MSSPTTRTRLPSMERISTTDSPSEFGRTGLEIANTPGRLVPFARDLEDLLAAKGGTPMKLEYNENLPPRRKALQSIPGTFLPGPRSLPPRRYPNNAEYRPHPSAHALSVQPSSPCFSPFFPRCRESKLFAIKNAHYSGRVFQSSEIINPNIEVLVHSLCVGTNQPIRPPGRPILPYEQLSRTSRLRISEEVAWQITGKRARQEPSRENLIFSS